MISPSTLRSARKQRRWTQARLAEALHVHVKSVRNWESPKVGTGVPAIREPDVRRALGESLDYVEYLDRVDPEDALSFSTWSEKEWDTREANLIASIDRVHEQMRAKPESPQVLIRDASDDQLLEELLRRTRHRELISTAQAVRAMREHPGYSLGVNAENVSFGPWRVGGSGEDEPDLEAVAAETGKDDGEEGD